ncbi:hypothetical protein T440DRAFT_385452 [Plenodomus tracheiphilus IPT5]|uniref:Myb-like domain-containing protein n=1 Tax=Plenodomus tracheiphilus IPT5 TaxID=1408161 RepID=A0A6A7BM68_9PLEO|nr:hypothetical protein T440DRAFT_385452 [Plenodomus tracheiphilus IPT5]
MADPNLPPRKVSMSYILGFSNKPFKDPPPPPRPPQPNALIQMVTTPGGIVEWTASDGRKGKLTGSGRQRLTAASLAKVDSAKEANGAKTNSKKAATEKAASEAGGMFGLFDAPDNDTKSDKKDQSKDDNASDWTQQQDERLMKLKTENPNLSWSEIAVEVGKSADQCKGRFKNIKPKDWKPDTAKKGGKNGKGGKNKGNNQNNNGQKGGNNQNKNGQKGSERNGRRQKETEGNDSGDVFGGAAGDLWGSGNDNFGGNTGGDAGNNLSGNDAAWNADNNTSADTGDLWGNKSNNGSAAGTNSGPAGWETFGATGNDANGRGGALDNTWDATPAADGVAAGATWGGTPAQDTNNDNNFGADNSWNTKIPAKAASKAPSKAATVKATSQNQRNQQSQPQHTSHNNTAQNVIVAPLELEVKPDDTFSADDLRLVARILQQDCSMVWNRVSWRFRDKTGRALHPDVFEQKITGHVEGKSSEKGERRRK